MKVMYAIAKQTEINAMRLTRAISKNNAIKTTKDNLYIKHLFKYNV